jgi:D-alanine-D-alanine ligase
LVHASSQSALQTRLAEHAKALGCPCYAEQYIDGREFNVSLLGRAGQPQVLPIAEIDFSRFPPHKPRIVGYDAKWTEHSFEYGSTPRKFDFAPSDRHVLDELESMASATWDLFGLAGYVRVDFRVDADSRPWVLEINANPCLSPDGGFAAALERAGIGFDQAIQSILTDSVGGFLRNPQTPV